MAVQEGYGNNGQRFDPTGLVSYAGRNGPVRLVLAGANVQPCFAIAEKYIPAIPRPEDFVRRISTAGET